MYLKICLRDIAGPCCEQRALRSAPVTINSTFRHYSTSHVASCRHHNIVTVHDIHHQTGCGVAALLVSSIHTTHKCQKRRFRREAPLQLCATKREHPSSPFDRHRSRRRTPAAPPGATAPQPHDLTYRARRTCAWQCPPSSGRHLRVRRMPPRQRHLSRYDATAPCI